MPYTNCNINKLIENTSLCNLNRNQFLGALIELSEKATD